MEVESFLYYSQEHTRLLDLVWWPKRWLNLVRYFHLLLKFFAKVLRKGNFIFIFQGLVAWKTKPYEFMMVAQIFLESGRVYTTERS